MNREIVLALLIERGPLSCVNLAAATHITESNALYHLKELHRRRMVYIADWIREPNKRDAAVWAAGSELDAPKLDKRDPRNYTKSAAPQFVSLSKEELAEIEERFYAREDAKRRERLLAEIVIRRDPFVEAFFGAYAA